MQHTLDDEKQAMDEALAAIRRELTAETRSDTTSAPAVPRPSDEAGIPDPGLLSPEASAAVSSAVNRLTKNVKKHEPTFEDVVRDALRPVLKSWLEENLPEVVERMVQAEIERVIRGR